MVLDLMDRACESAAGKLCLEQAREYSPRARRFFSGSSTRREIGTLRQDIAILRTRWARLSWLIAT